MQPVSQALGTRFGGCFRFHSPCWPIPKLERGLGLGDVPHSIHHADQSPSWRGDWVWGMFSILFSMLTNPQAGEGLGLGDVLQSIPHADQSPSRRGTGAGDVPHSIPHVDLSPNWRGTRARGCSPFYSSFWPSHKLERDWDLGDVPYSDQSLNWGGDWRLGDVPHSFWPILKLRREISSILSQGLVRMGNRTGSLVAWLGYQTSNPGSPDHISGNPENSLQCVLEMWRENMLFETLH